MASAGHAGREDLFAEGGQAGAASVHEVPRSFGGAPGRAGFAGDEACYGRELGRDPREFGLGYAVGVPLNWQQ
jgi:hypothetical protein